MEPLGPGALDASRGRWDEGAELDTSDRGALAAAAAYLGISARDLRADLRDGRSLRHIAAARGKTVDGLERALFADLRSHLDGAVAAGRITLAVESRLLADAPTRIERLVGAPTGRG